MDIVWDGGRTAKAATVGFHSRNLWPSVYMASNVKKKCKLIKKHLGRGNFVLFSNSEKIPLFLSLNKIHATKYVQGYRVYIKCFILTLFPFSFIWVQISWKWRTLQTRFPTLLRHHVTMKSMAAVTRQHFPDSTFISRFRDIFFYCIFFIFLSLLVLHPST